MKGKDVVRQGLNRRFSDFDFLFEVLFKKYPGVIFPAFPEKGIMSYVKTKVKIHNIQVTITKDIEYLKSRIKVVQRFMNRILNDSRFQVQNCSQMSKFLAEDKEFELHKKTEKGSII